MKPVDAIIESNRTIRKIERGRLFRKYFLLILALVCGALLLSGGIGIYFSYQENKVALSSVQREKAVAAAARIEQFIRQIEQQLAFAALPQLGSEGIEQRRIEFLKLQRLVPAITDTAQIDAKGREQLAVSRLAMDVVGSSSDRSRDPAFLGAKPKQTWFGPVNFRKETEPYISIAVRSSEGGPVTVADVNLKFIWDVITRIKIGKKGKAYVVDSTGHLVADPDIGLVLRKTDLSKLPQVKYALDKSVDDSRALIARDVGGEEVLTAFGSIDPLGWRVFVEQPVTEVYATLDAAIFRTVALMVAGLLFSILAAMWLARSMVRPIRTLQEGAARIGAGDLEQRIEVKTGDELEALAEQFNQMMVQLRDSYAGLEKKVDERTAELQETLKQQTATAEILKVISSSVANAQPVFDKIVDSCQRLLAVEQVGIILIRDDERIEIGAHSGSGAEEIGSVFPMPLEGTSTALAITQRNVMHWPDVFGAPNVPESVLRAARLTGTRALMMAPMLWEGRGVGSIYVGRTAPGDFSDKEMGLLKTFADQAVIAVQNARLFREIQDKSRQLEIANQHKSEFLANMSHELRTPLNAIIGFSEVLVEKVFGEVNDKQLDYLKDIHSSGRHLLSLINDILDLSKIEAGRMELDVAEFDLRSALQNAITLVKERAQRHGIALSLGVDERLGAFKADERKFKQILLNLLSNAVKFTPEGGKVSVDARPAANGVEISVSDTGVGIAAADQQLVFEEFRQVGQDYTRKAEGTGLGLALTKRFVELHGGTIRLHSEPGKGSTFTFTIPART